MLLSMHAHQVGPSRSDWRGQAVRLMMYRGRARWYWFLEGDVDGQGLLLWTRRAVSGNSRWRLLAVWRGARALRSATRTTR